MAEEMRAKRSPSRRITSTPSGSPCAAAANTCSADKSEAWRLDFSRDGDSAAQRRLSAAMPSAERRSIPGAMIIYLAGLLSIPGEVYEAASLDGSGAWRQFRSITFPLVFGYVIINSILGLKNFLNVYDVIVGLTNGGPGTATTSIAMTIFTGFSSGDYAYQMANAVLFFILTIVVSLLQLSLIRNRDVEL
jgi:ABC-type molybdate transport system permease subunit